MTDFKVFTPSF